MLPHVYGKAIFKLFLICIVNVFSWICLENTLSILMTCSYESQPFLWLNQWVRNAGYINCELDNLVNHPSPRFLSNSGVLCEMTSVPYITTIYFIKLFSSFLTLFVLHAWYCPLLQLYLLCDYQSIPNDFSSTDDSDR